MFITRPKPDDVGVVIDGTEFRHWSELEIALSIDQFSTVSFTAPFEADRREFRQTFRPFTFKPLKVTLGGQAMFTGTLVGVHPRAEANSSSVEVNGYALAGVLDDCTAPAATAPHEFKKLKLGAIASAVCKPFGLTVQMRDDAGSRFEKVKLEEDRKVLDFLIELAQQRNLVITNTPDGMPMFWKSVTTGSPVARLNGNESPITTVSASFSPQEYYSEITGFAGARRGRRGGKWTERNRWLSNVLRPLSFKLDNTEKGDAPEETRAKLGRMFANAASFTIDNLPTWRDPSGDVWAPNTTVMLLAPNAMVYRETELLIRKVTLRQRADSRTASLELCLPGVFSAEVPPSLPWDA